MKLKDAFLCIDCDEVFASERAVFASERSQSNRRCPSCTSSVVVPLSVWVQTWGAFEKSLAGASDHDVFSGRPKLELIDHPHIAA